MRVNGHTGRAKTPLRQGDTVHPSRMGSIDDNSSGGYHGYRLSKTALTMSGRSLAVDLRPRGVAGIPPEQAARGQLARIDNLSLGSSGRFWHANGGELPW